ncbi:hypothetical protein BJY52DRAFT_623655 [Lactarius psammicola]|nr:hypothetical protein BJY52DRAFT_623655 [Lactarius psammicola]
MFLLFSLENLRCTRIPQRGLFRTVSISLAYMFMSPSSSDLPPNFTRDSPPDRTGHTSFCRHWRFRLQPHRSRALWRATKCRGPSMRGVCDHGKRTTRASLCRGVWEVWGVLIFEKLDRSPWVVPYSGTNIAKGTRLGLVRFLASKWMWDTSNRQQQQAGTGVDGACKVGANDLRRPTATGRRARAYSTCPSTPQRRRIATAFEIVETAVSSCPLLVCPLCSIRQFISAPPSLASHSHTFVIFHSLNQMRRAVFMKGCRRVMTGLDVVRPTQPPVAHTI